MKEEELIKKLERVEIPRIELESHRSRLRMALLNAGYLKRQRGVTILDLAKSKVKRGIDTMIRGLVSRQPVWKTALSSVLAIALITGLSMALPSLFGQSDEALATEIAQNSSEVIAALGGDEVETVKVIVIEDDMATMIVEGKMGAMVTALVDLDSRIVTKAVVVVTRAKVVTGSQLTDEEKEKVLNIVKADPRVRELLDKGAVIIDMVLPVYVYEEKINKETGEIEGVQETWAQAWITGIDGSTWGALVDLVQGKVVQLLE